MNWAMYALMAADAYNATNEQNDEVAAMDNTILNTFGFEKDPSVGTNGFGELDSATYSHSSGMQLSKYSDGPSDVAISFRGTEFLRSTANAGLDKDTLAGWLMPNLALANLGNYVFECDGVSALMAQARAAVDYVKATIENKGVRVIY